MRHAIPYSPPAAPGDRLRSGRADHRTARPAWADPAPSFQTLLERIGASPSAAEADALLEAAEARVRQARVRPNPTAALEAENAFGSGPFSGYDNAETTLSLTQDLELWGRRGARVEVARAEAGTAALRRDQAVVDAAGRLALVYAEAEAAERRFALAEEALGLTIADAARPSCSWRRGASPCCAASRPRARRRPPAPPGTRRRRNATRPSPA
ncbi:TolC family protein [Brevundimonas denitrificans]|uniref:TolC family protein n=1 Tax=Brevundimonas denitrificans TaxID=1443434 RepID=UPI00223B76A9|nr:TolC family protein [Brevundimonas denitrificans]